MSYHRSKCIRSISTQITHSTYLWWQLQSNNAAHMHRRIAQHLAHCWLSYFSWHKRQQSTKQWQWMIKYYFTVKILLYMLIWQGSCWQRTWAGRGQQWQTTINHWQEHLVMQISLAGFGGALASLSLVQWGQCPFVPLRRCLAIGRRANNRRWFPPRWLSGMSSPCNGRRWVGGGHNNCDDYGNNDNRRIVPWSVDGARGGQLRDRGGHRQGAGLRNS